MKRPDPALAVATLALCLALGGTGYAATKIGTSQLRNRAVTAPKLAPGSVTGAAVADGSLTPADFAGGVISRETVTIKDRGGVRAFASINADGTMLAGAEHAGVVGLSRAAPGSYCIALAPGLDPHLPVVASGDAGRSLNDAILVTTSAVVERCAPGALEITTWNLTERGPAPSDEAFTIVVP